MSEISANRPTMSVVVPVFNERDNLEPLVEELREVLGAEGIDHEILLVNDGSTDGSGEVVNSLAGRGAGIRGLHLRANSGQTAAFDAGFRAARGDVVVTIDADLQNDPRDIHSLLECLEKGNDAVVGYRLHRVDGTVRRLSSILANAVRNLLSGDDIIDTGCSLKVFRRESLARIKMYDGMHRFLPTLLRMEGCRVAQVPVNHRVRRSGSGKYGVWNRVLRAFVDLLAVRWMKKRKLDYEVIGDEPL